MNWTGGSLSRSRRQTANLNVIQKKHFAKARAKLLNTRPSPVRLGLSIFRDEKNTGARVSNPAVPGPNHLEQRPTTQLTLEEYKGIKPLVRQLQSLKPRHAPRSMSCRVTKSRPPSPRLDDDPSLASQVKYRGSNISAKGQNDRKKATGSVVDPAGSPPATDELEAKRRELLVTSDWMGLKKIKPLQIRFADAEDRDLIGKRRRVDNDLNQTKSAPILHRTPVISSYEKRDMLRARSRLLSSPSKISIHIGSSGRGSLARPQEENSCGRGINHEAVVSDDMLFNDLESVRFTTRNQVSTQNSFRPSANPSDEMLFDREWSGISSSTNRSSYQELLHSRPQPTRVDKGPPVAHSISSDTEPNDSGDPAYTEDRHERQDEQNLDLRYALQGSTDPFKIAEPLKSIGSEIRGPGKDSEPFKMRHTKGFGSHDRGQEEHFSEQAAPQEEEKSPHAPRASRHSAVQRSVTRQDYMDEEQPSAQAKGQDSGRHSTHAESSQRPSLHVNHGHITEASPPTPRPGDIDKDKFQITATEQQHWNELFHRQDDPTPTLREPSPHERVATCPPAKALSRAPSPRRSPPIPSHKHVKDFEPPADPTPEEDEIIWRTFVFGTANPDEDWSFENPVQGRETPHRLHRPSNSSSSPLPTLAENASASASSPKPQTQPSLLAEASCSSSSSPSSSVAPAPRLSSSSPARPQPLPSTIAEFPPTSSDPTPPAASPAGRTQHSMQAEAHTSSDELALSPARLPPPPRPPVVFRKPRRFVGESLSSSPVAPLRLGVAGPGAKRGKRGEDEEGYAEGRRKRKRRDWRGELQAAMEVKNVEKDEIVDD
ncbi:MAG: hypothetical protein LQ348_000121 [Seirophora lacunosa]|nr:MAG: hypothetical protein LQ348_000121 [Seirophora lacunosa]